MGRLDLIAIAAIVCGGLWLRLHGLAFDDAGSWAAGAAIVAGLFALFAGHSGPGSIWDLKPGSRLNAGGDMSGGGSGDSSSGSDGGGE